MEKTAINELHEAYPYVISVTIHAVLLALIFSITFINYHFLKKKSLAQSARAIDIESIAVSSGSESQSTGADRGAGPWGLNDSAGRELLEAARSGISITPDNFLEYVRIRELRKGLGRPKVAPREGILKKYPFLKGSGQFDSGIGGKLKSDFHDCYKEACAMLNLTGKERASQEDEPEKFTAAIQDYLSGKRPVRTWRTLWMVPRPATEEDKILLVRLLRRLHIYGIEGGNAGYEHMRLSIRSLLEQIPDELKFPAAGKK